MTSKAAAAQYEQEFMAEYRGRKPAVFNPQNKQLKDLPIIYGFNNGGPSDLLHGQIIAEDGTALGGHLCSSENYMLHDLGILENTRPDRHELFQKHYPDGYRMVFLSYEEAKKNDGLRKAYELNKRQEEQ